MLLSTGPSRCLGVATDDATLRIGPIDPASATSSRHLFLNGDPAFELSFWCGTCPFLFERKFGANTTVSGDRAPMERLERGLDAVEDDVIEVFASLLPEGDYLPLLLEVRPERVAPRDARDYFTHEQVSTWGIDPFWRLPHDPRSFYYRTFETPVDSDAHLYEFVVPMVPPDLNDDARVQHYRDLIVGGVTPTAVALSVLDVRQPATTGPDADHYAHWGLSHFLLDGHHKFDAAAQSGEAVRLLALVNLGESIARPHEVARLPEILARPRADR